ncbi:hypothetical protein NBRC116494_01140 [Aurantivibrio plasticivorans]
MAKLVSLLSLFYRSTLCVIPLICIPHVYAEPWHLGFVVEYYELAHYYGSDSVQRDLPGTDCPQGTNPDNDWPTILTTPYRTRAEAIAALDPERVDERTRGPNGYSLYYNRGPNRENVYDNPTVLPDPGMYEVEGDIAFGFNLDGDESTGFTGVNGVPGVDNAFYKSSGCVLRFRGQPREAGTGKNSNDSMHDGAFTIVMLLSGNESPMNDSNAKLGFYLSKDDMVKDANGDIAADYSFRIDPDTRFQDVSSVRIKDGIVTNISPETLTLRDFYAPAFYPKELVLEQSQFQFELKPDGSLFGYMGGYRDWREHYRGTAGNGRSAVGAIHEVVGKINLPAWWYSLRRNADGLPDPETGEMRGISTTYAITALPAFVISPNGQHEQALAQSIR